ncbi:ABC transporter permease [Ruania suaedae]|uniref:FtsX-like permease family protein n=1 Tax=Ruania suaedae TaxID=2897774 RepID=UPI001E5383BF|nr:ABC transporter permease [Ruania suaedae]UFU03744.1 ABC transporter permease [Ruania suaedae]
MRAALTQIGVRALRAHWPSALGVFFTMLLAAALVSGSFVLIESGLRAGDPFSPTATMLPTVMGSFAGVALMLAILVVSSAFAAALRDRRREFALLRAVGATSRQVRTLISAEVMVISIGALLLGSVAGFAGARALVPLLIASGMADAGFAPVLSPWPFLSAVAVLLPAAWIAGRLAAREMAELGPAAAVSSSAVEARPLGQGRVVGAWVCVAAGLAATATPVFVPGSLGGATGASSAFLFITAVALAGPALVRRATAFMASRAVLGRGGARALATANTRGFSRRMTAAVVPLALLVSLGAVQTGVDRIVSDAGTQQLTDALGGGDLVWQGPAGELAGARESLAALPGVQAVATTDAGVAQVRVDEQDEDLPFLDVLAWEHLPVRMLDDASGLIDPGVVEGDLDALERPGTIAVSSDALLGKGMGDQVEVRSPGGESVTATVVAVYDRGLGIGDMVMGPDAFAAMAQASGAPSLLAQPEPGRQEEVRLGADAAGLALVPTEEFASEVTAASDADTRLSTTLLMVLLAFIGIAAANALVIATRFRSGEFALLGRLGTTRRQLRAMLAVEAAFVGLGAVTIGTLTALPGLVVASSAISGAAGLGVDATMYAALAGSAVVIAFLGVAGARFRPAG